MNESAPQTDDALDKLQAEIDNAKVDDARGEALQEISEYIRLLREEPEGEHSEPLRERLEDVVTLFDAEHHRLVVQLQHAIAVLSNAGV
jgi:type II secretory pathway predicted ATPase ExeA